LAPFESPIFEAVNIALSGTWGLLFLLLALAHMLRTSALSTTAVIVAGALISIFAPKLLMRVAISQRIAAYGTYRCP